ncbi:MAG: hypothetical protein GEV11_01535 [Streptosporangiales bacterium]|nr:hypothetical protein [Streptosporangiales bacterium]
MTPRPFLQAASTTSALSPIFSTRRSVVLARAQPGAALALSTEASMIGFGGREASERCCGAPSDCTSTADTAGTEIGPSALSAYAPAGPLVA